MFLGRALRRVELVLSLAIRLWRRIPVLEVAMRTREPLVRSLSRRSGTMRSFPSGEVCGGPTALGIVLSSVAVARAEHVLAGGGQNPDTDLALTEGFQTAFLVAFGIAAMGALWRSFSDLTSPRAP